MADDREEKGNQKILCRCNDVTLKDVEETIDSGITDLEVLRKYLRVGMGPCQGRTCLPLLRTILARKTGVDIEKLGLPKARAPLIPVPFKFFNGEGKSDET